LIVRALSRLYEKMVKPSLALLLAPKFSIGMVFGKVIVDGLRAMHLGDDLHSYSYYLQYYRKLNPFSF
jgi:hypothetical protein